DDGWLSQLHVLGYPRPGQCVHAALGILGYQGPGRKRRYYSEHRTPARAHRRRREFSKECENSEPATIPGTVVVTYSCLSQAVFYFELFGPSLSRWRSCCSCLRALSPSSSIAMATHSPSAITLGQSRSRPDIIFRSLVIAERIAWAGSQY